MIKNYLLVTFRTIFRQKTYSFINIFGLAVGITSFLIILLYVQNELSYNRHIEDAQNKYRMVEIQHPPGIGEQYVAVTMGPLAAALKNDFPEVKQSMRITGGGTIFVTYQDKSFNEEFTAFADTNVFDMLSLKLLRGNPEVALQGKNTVVISRKLSEKYFGSIDDVVGKVLEIANEPFTVNGVMEDMTNNSHIHFEMVMPFTIMEDRFQWMRSWGSNSLDTYIQLTEDTKQEEFEKKLPDFMVKYTQDTAVSRIEIYIQPILDIHLRSNHIKFQQYNYKQGDINQVYIFSAVALLILIVACINYINLSTARAVKRSREVGIRKTAGAQRESIIFQFLGESVFLTFLSTTIAVVFVELLLSYINDLLGTGIDISLANLSVVGSLIILVIIIGLLSGSYPAFYLSAFNPVKVLKGGITSGNQKGGAGSLRKSLVVIQFVISIIILVSTLVSMAQVNYFQKKDKGYNDEAVYAVSFHESDAEQRIKKMELYKSEIESNSNILNISLASGATGIYGSQGQIHVADTSEASIMVRFGAVDDNYFNMMEIPVIKGRSFSKEYSTDLRGAIILNEIAVEKLSWEQPLGKEFRSAFGDTLNNMKVVGVVQDYNYYSLLSPIEPAAYFYNPERFYKIMVKIHPNNFERTVDNMETKWNELFPKAPFDGYFMDDLFQYRYKNQINSMKVFGIFAVICILISCLGLYGLVAYMVTQRTKEIAIRKAMGSTSFNIVKIINKDFIKLIIVSSIIAVPVSYYYMSKWLSNFVYRIDLSWYYFAIAILVALIIAIITNLFHTMKAAVKNPAETLRYE